MPVASAKKSLAHSCEGLLYSYAKVGSSDEDEATTEAAPYPHPR